jgi:geranylgeranyl reductase family protein
MSEVVDLAVVGAGPAGAAAAATAARAGLSVTVLDRATFPRDKCCGDGLTTASLRHLDDLGLDPAAVASWSPVSDVVVRSPSGRRLDLAVGPEHAPVAVARRMDLDAALVEIAAQAGAEIRQGCGLQAARVAGPEVVLDSTAGQIRARFVIGADGAWSPLRKALGEQQVHLGEWHAMRQYLSHVDGPEAEALWVWFEPELLPAYAWSFPVGNHTVNFGIGMIRRPGHPSGQLKATWDLVLSRPHIARLLGRAQPEARIRAWPIPADLRRRDLTAAGGRVLFAGDAARAADPMTGEGIGQALATGKMAAEAVIEAGIGAPERAAALYRRRIQSGLVLDNRVSAGLSRILTSPVVARGAVRIAAATPATRSQFARFMFEDYPRAAPLTPWRWNLRRGDR